MKRNWKRKLTLFVTLALLLTFAAGCGTAQPQEPSGSAQEGIGQPAELLSGKHHAEIRVKDYGTISLELDADAAPVTVTNFVNLANAGFYDGLTFHRVVPGFVLQGGDPDGNGTGGSDEAIVGEFSANGYENNLSHTRGAISMARRGNDNNSATSQFFIVLQDATSLDGQYAAFGYVTDGMELVDQICEDTPVADMSTGAVNPEDQPVIETITVLD